MIRLQAATATSKRRILQDLPAGLFAMRAATTQGFRIGRIHEQADIA